MSDLKVRSGGPGTKSGLLSPSKGQLSKKGSQTQSQMQRSQIRQRSKLMSGSRHRMDDGDHDDEWLVAKDPIKPADQLELSEVELKQEFTRIINANNPNAPDNIIRFSFKDLEYKQLGTVDHCSFHFSLDGNMVHKESDEARRQISRQKMSTKKKKKKTKSTGTGPDEGIEDTEPKAEEEQAGEEGAGEEGGEAEGEEGAEGDEEIEQKEEEEEEEEVDDGQAKPLRNQFNFSERASQTFNYSMKERGTMTEPPPQYSYSANVTQFVIYEAYKAHLEKQAALKAKGGEAASSAPEQAKAPEPDVERGAEEGSSWGAVAKVVSKAAVQKLERMVNQNTFDEIISDFAFYDDPSDDFKVVADVLMDGLLVLRHGRYSRLQTPIATLANLNSYYAGGGRNGFAAVEVCFFENQEDDGDGCGVEPTVSRHVCRRLRKLRLCQPSGRVSACLFAQKPKPPRVPH
eukprot:m.166294 g.166294  ORF g.166294 m.166294 type:complete len:459 (-) comp17751_c0_seq4:1147-2523(-)